MIIDLTIDPKKTTEHIVQFIRDTVHGAGFKDVVLGLSGGIDSAVSATLAVHALGAVHVHVGLFPYGKLSVQATNDALLVANHLTIQPTNIYKRDIKNIVDLIGLSPEDQGSTLSGLSKLRMGNITARTRMILLYDLSKKIPALVLGTENKTENLLGYFTRFGDGASDIEPIETLYKTQVRQLAEYLKVPLPIIQKAPTAGLWDGQTDEGEFGFSYKDADKILFLLNDKKYSKSKIIALGYDKNLVTQILKRVQKNAYKHDVPYILGENIREN